MRCENVTLASISVGNRGSYGIAASAVNFSENLYTYLRITDITDDGKLDTSGLKSVDDKRAHLYLLKPNDIVFARTGASTGRNYFYDGSDGELVYAGFLIKFSLDPAKVNPRYIKYYCMSSQYKNWIRAFNNGSTRGNINAQTFGNMPILLPPRIQQDNIASILSPLDDKIDLNRRINANLEEQARAIFKHWFIDAETGGKAGIFSDLIEDVISGDWGKDSQGDKNSEAVYCIRGADIPEVKTGGKGKMPVRYIPKKNYDAKRLMPGDIVIEISGGSPTQSTGRAAAISQSLLDRYDRDMICTNFCRALKPKAGYSMFAYYYLQYMYSRNIFFVYENGTTGIKNLDLSSFMTYEETIIPPAELVRKFDDICQNIFDVIFANGRQNETLANIRDSLLPKLISGEIIP